MGKRNRRRRRDNQKQQPPGGHAGRGPTPGPRRLRSVDDPQFAAQEFSCLAAALARGRLAEADEIVARLSGAAGAAEAASAALRVAAGVAWERGWQPADLVHAFGRKQSGPDRRLLVGVVVAEAGEWRRHPQADPGWLQQVDDLEGDLPRAAGRGCLLGDWAAAEGVDGLDALLRAAELVDVLWSAPGLPPAGDPPSAWGRATAPPHRPAPAATARAGAGIDQRILSRVRALLAKAESTEFAPEAEAFTEKAQELMARYAIDHALVSAGGDDSWGERPVSRRVLIHDPYAKGKAGLLSRVAGANRCQAVWSRDFGFSTVFGFPTDLSVTDVLYTSLVSQCSKAMLAASKGVASPRSFRESFVISFAVHIGDRLQAATAATVRQATADHGDALLPVLASRDARVEAARQDAFPHLRKMQSRTVDRRGWLAGQAAAELAHLDTGKRITR